MDITAVFDIGKTHKKFLLLDDNFQLITEDSRKIAEIEDEDGFPCDNLDAICEWIHNKINEVNSDGNFKIRRLNFSTYGASLVHLDENDNLLTPLYNYLKPIPQKIEEEFYDKYGPATKFAQETSSPSLGMLNSGLQLFWLKKTKPKTFNRIASSLHFPNYLAMLFHGRKLSDLTSIGCHTALWDFKNNKYHPWVSEEGIINKLPHISSGTVNLTDPNNPDLEVGTGLHDSSAALVPYLLKFKKPFILLSTGTWNICLNPFNNNALTAEDLRHDSLHFFSFLGKPVFANRLFLGNEHDTFNRKLCEYFNKDRNYHKNIKVDKAIIAKLMAKKNGTEDFDLKGYFSNNNSITPLSGDLDPEHFTTFEEAYHDLVLKLVSCQIRSIEHTLSDVDIQDIYISGGFIDNELFTYLLALHFESKNIYQTSLQRASAIGAALVMHERKSEVAKNLIEVKKINP